MLLTCRGMKTESLIKYKACRTHAVTASTGIYARHVTPTSHLPPIQVIRETGGHVSGRGARASGPATRRSEPLADITIAGLAADT